MIVQPVRMMYEVKCSWVDPELAYSRLDVTEFGWREIRLRFSQAAVPGSRGRKALITFVRWTSKYAEKVRVVKHRLGHTDHLNRN